LNDAALSAFNDLSNRLHHHEQTCVIAGKTLKAEFLIPTLAPHQGVVTTIRYHVKQNRMTTNRISDDAGLLENMVHEKTAETQPLGFLVDRHLTEKQNRDFTVAWSASWLPGQLGNIHHPDIDRMITKDRCLTGLDSDINPCHGIFLLLSCRQFQKIVQPLDATIKPGVIMSCRVPVLNIKRCVFIQH